MNNQTVPAILISASKACPVSQNKQPLASLSCDISSGTVIFLVGLQHSITLPYMHMLAGIEIAGSGQVTLLGNNCLDMTSTQKQLLRQQVGFVMQGGPLLSVLNGVENLKLAAHYHQTGDEQFIQQKAELLLADMPEEFDNLLLPTYMTKLQRRLLAIARPLMLNLQILFLDNPFEGLGHHDKVVVSRYISNLAKNSSITLVINSDDLYFAHSHANQIIFCDYDETIVFNSWQDFYDSKRETIALLFENDHIKTDA